ncbi:DUF1642 domain-containing protein [Lactococcus lactis]|uniref:DUF1642 domain-containing protein n=1 Tax=Lactococcus lactis TaxID=1358 RepID=A0A9X4NLF8_9LACT|nr:DUF1642 domain-containing protein [Lactococcus lactis]MDG4985164.1 DUF1642 domain-containing protein [Lactococcus lactis]
MTKQDYIDKITKNLEHLTKDELKDVSILTTAQYGVRLKVAEKEYIEKEISNLTPQLQQQALPVVPEDIAKFINTKLDKSKNLQDLYDEPLFHTGENYLADDEYDFIHWFNENTTLFEKAWTNGFTVEKPQLFYLKHIDMSKNDEQVDWYMSKAHRRVGHNACEKRKLPIYDSFKYTQQEIDSMQTGSYEQIEVGE